jgi:hypothetical protein
VKEEVPMPIAPCESCRVAVDVVARLTQLAYQGSGLTLSAMAQEENGGCKGGESIRVSSLFVNCQRCKNTRYVFTEAGVAMIGVLQRQGYLPKGPPPPVNLPGEVSADSATEVPF